MRRPGGATYGKESKTTLVNQLEEWERPLTGSFPTESEIAVGIPSGREWGEKASKHSCTGRGVRVINIPYSMFLI